MVLTRVVAAVLSAGAVAGCSFDVIPAIVTRPSEAARDAAAAKEQEKIEHAQSAQAWQRYREVAEAILVTPGDLNKPYEILGPVEWPGRGQIIVFGAARCTPDRLRAVAVAAWGASVNAIIGYTAWRDGSQLRCGGTAVRWRDLP